MHPSLSTLGLLAAALSCWMPRAEPQSPDPATQAPPAAEMVVLPAARGAARSIEARAGSIQARDEATRRKDGGIRIERFVLEPCGDPSPEPAAAPARPVERDPSADVRAALPVSARSNSVPSADSPARDEPAGGSATGGSCTIGSKPIGVIEWRRLAHDDGFQVECEMLFARRERDLPCQRVLHVEEMCNASARLVWREMGSGSGRSLLVEWTPGGLALRTVQWNKDETLREEINAQDGAVMPLYLIEMLRQGRATTGRYPVFDPLACSLSELELYTSYGDDAPAEGPLAGASSAPEAGCEGARSGPGPTSRLRTVELWRADGSLWGRYRFRGAELVAFQWQDGGPWARRASAGEYEAALSELQHDGEKDP
jgi:hypothetical protein